MSVELTLLCAFPAHITGATALRTISPEVVIHLSGQDRDLIASLPEVEPIALDESVTIGGVNEDTHDATEDLGGVRLGFALARELVAAYRAYCAEYVVPVLAPGGQPHLDPVNEAAFALVEALPPDTRCIYWWH